MSTTTQLPDSRAFGPVPRTGVIYVMERAAELGYTPGHPDWANLGQGAPETGPLDGSPPRLDTVPVVASSSEYAPVAGLPELRQAVADLYNHRYRKGKASKYGPRNVAIAAGGRTALTRVAAALDRHGQQVAHVPHPEPLGGAVVGHDPMVRIQLHRGHGATEQSEPRLGSGGLRALVIVSIPEEQAHGSLPVAAAGPHRSPHRKLEPLSTRVR